MIALLCTAATTGCAPSAIERGDRAVRAADLDRAAEHYTEATSQPATRFVAWMRLGHVEVLREHLVAAREAFAEAARIAPRDSEPRIQLGHTHELERHYEEAEHHYELATRLEPHAARPHRILGARRLAWGEYERAIPPLRTAATLGPRHEETWHALALAYGLAGRFADSVAAYGEGLRHLPSSRRLHIGLAKALLARGDRAGAARIFGQWTARHPNDEATRTALALTLHALGRTAAATAALREAPGGPTARMRELLREWDVAP